MVRIDFPSAFSAGKTQDLTGLPSIKNGARTAPSFAAAHFRTGEGAAAHEEDRPAFHLTPHQPGRGHR